jgi:hypothetical protein
MEKSWNEKPYNAGGGGGEHTIHLSLYLFVKHKTKKRDNKKTIMRVQLLKSRINMLNLCNLIIFLYFQVNMLY